VVLSSASPSIILIDSSQPADQRRWRISTLAGGFLNFDSENDAGGLITRFMFFRRDFLTVNIAGAMQTQVIGVSNRIDMSEVPVATVNGQAAGTLANFSDSTTAVIGGTVAGGGTNHVLARWNGTVWKVVA
jgi:hypothetical protein